MKKLLVNIICACVPSKQIRKRLRVRLKYPIIKDMTVFAKTLSTQKRPDIKYTYGYRCANFVVTVDNKLVLKFPLTTDGIEISLREKRITDALRPISPIKIPDMEILNWNGLAVRKYEYISGVSFNALSREQQNMHVKKMAKQLAHCLYVIGKSDPKEIRDLKNKKSEKPGFKYGWSQHDLWDNFIMNPETFDIVGFIDWEGASFGDFEHCMMHGTGNQMMKKLLNQEYAKLFKAKK